MRTRRSNTSTTNGKKKENTSSPIDENLTTSSTTGSKSDRQSPSISDKNTDEKSKKHHDFKQKPKRRRADTEGESASKKKKDGSDSESGSDVSSGLEGQGNQVESDSNIVEDYSDASRPASPANPVQVLHPSSSFQPAAPVAGTPTNLSANNSPAPTNFGAPVTKDENVSVSGQQPAVVFAPSPAASNCQPLALNAANLVHPTLQHSNLPLGTNPFSQAAAGGSPIHPAPLTTNLPTANTTNSPHNHLRPSQTLPSYPQNQQHPRLATSSQGGHISGIGTITNTGGHPIATITNSGHHLIGSITNTNHRQIGNIGASTSVACNFSPLVIPSPALSRASSTGTFIPRTELSVPSISNSLSSGIDSIATTVAKATSIVSATDSHKSSANLAGVGDSTPTGNPTIPNQSAPASNKHGSGSSGHLSRMQHDQASPVNENMDKKAPSLPSHSLPPSHLPPSSFLPGHHPGLAPFSPYHHYYYPGHPGTPHHLPPHLAALHPAAMAATAPTTTPPPPSSSSSSTSSSSTAPHNPLSTQPPPIPSLVPIKKEAHSPPPPLKSSTDSKPQDILSASSSLHSIHRSSLPPSDPTKLPSPFQQAGLPSSTAPLPPPPLTVIDPRTDNQTSSKPDDLSKPSSDHFSSSKDRDSNLNNIRGMNPSPHRLDIGLPSSAALMQQHQARMDSNLSILSESREIGLKNGIKQTPSQLHSCTLDRIKEEPNTNPPGPPLRPPSSSHHGLPQAQTAFQSYPHPHPLVGENLHLPGLPPLNPSSSQVQTLPATSSSLSLSTPSSSSSVLQVPQPSHHGAAVPPHHLDTNLHGVAAAAGRPPELLATIKKEPVAVEEIHVDDEDDDEPSGGSTTPGPTPTICNREFYKSNSAIFVKVFDRGERNQCCRTDFVFKPLSGSNLAKKREERLKRAHQHAAHSASSREEKKRVETPPRATSASEGQKVSSSSSNLNSSSSQSHPGHGPPTPYTDRHTPRQFTDTPALRQLHEYARPHVLNADPRAGPYSLAGLPPHPHMDPLLGYRLGMFPPGSRERLELELERDKRERDAREREMRERELRDMELRDKLELKPGLERLLPPGASQLTDPASWLELQRRMGFPHAGGGPLVPQTGPSPGAVGSHVPGIYPPVSLASDLLARERDKLDRFGLAANLPQLAADISYASAVERLSQERQAAERQAAERERDRERLAALASADPSTRLQLAGAAAAATQHAHTHTHAHSHTHLHLHQQEVAAHAQAVAQAQAHGLTPPAFPLSTLGGHGHPLYPHHLAQSAPGADPSSGGLPSSSGTPMPVLPPGVMHHPLLAGISNREELLQREIYSRSGHFIDPALAHQLSAQAAAHEALQRQIAMERERFGSSGHLPH